jgi:translation elongation factor EF-Tu-like GTPase
MNETKKILANIEFSLNNTSRQNPFYSGYRPVFTFADARTKLSGRIALINKGKFGQGESGNVEITSVKDIIDDEHFNVGQKFTFAEEPNQVGKGHVIEIISR